MMIVSRIFRQLAILMSRKDKVAYLHSHANSDIDNHPCNAVKVSEPGGHPLPERASMTIEGGCFLVHLQIVQGSDAHVASLLDSDPEKLCVGYLEHSNTKWEHNRHNPVFHNTRINRTKDVCNQDNYPIYMKRNHGDEDK